MAEIEDAGEIGESCPSQDGERGGEGGPEDEGGNREKLQPMGLLTATGFEDEGAEVFGILGADVPFGEPAEQGTGIGETMFPGADTEVTEIDFFRPFEGEDSIRKRGGIEFGERTSDGPSRDREVDDGDAETVEEGQAEGWKFNRHHGLSIAFCVRVVGQ